VQIQRLSDGKVDATLWGYSLAEVNAVMGVATEAPAPPPEARDSHPQVG
jgi:hypothetical protein